MVEVPLRESSVSSAGSVLRKHRLELLKWYKRVGDSVQEMEPVCKLQSDKAAVDVTSPHTGIVSALAVAEGDTLEVGDTLMEIDAEAPPTVERPRLPRATPGARKLAAQMGIDINAVKPAVGTAITKKDIEESQTDVTCAPIAMDQPTAVVGKLAVMAKATVASLKAPVMHVGEDLDVTRLLALKKSMAHSFAEVYERKLTLTPLLIRAISMASCGRSCAASWYDTVW
eukprot:Polyplicarium_translucidae@DN2563_c0_g1_i3.p1